MPGVCLLHSGLQAYGLGRYSILAAQPQRSGRLGQFRQLPEFMAKFPKAEGGPLPFYGGAVGYIAYEGNVRFAVYSGAVVFDHERNEVFLASLNKEPDASLRELEARVCGEAPPRIPPFELKGELACNFAPDEFKAAVSTVRERIRDGQVYQANLSQRFSGRCAGSAFDLFLRLAEESPAPYAAYLDFGDEQVVSSSPERFLELREGRALTRPIKGTRPAGTGDEDVQARDLAASEKDRSELLMIVDLERNDLGRVCRPGSVAVENLFALERYATVLHQTAEVGGILEEGRDALGCIEAMFPGGSITGAPKSSAMQLIRELERGERGVYTGAIGYLAASGDADFNIAIRTVRVANGELSFHVGGGIVWDSDPQSEYEETLVKAKAMLKAIGAKNV